MCRPSRPLVEIRRHEARLALHHLLCSLDQHVQQFLLLFRSNCKTVTRSLSVEIVVMAPGPSFGDASLGDVGIISLPQHTGRLWLFHRGLLRPRKHMKISSGSASRAGVPVAMAQFLLVPL